MSVLWTPLFSIAVFLLIFSIGDMVANVTKGLVSTAIVGCLIYLVGFWTGIIPPDSLSETGFPDLMMKFGIPLMITNLGTMIDLKSFIKEWKTVLIAVMGVVGVGIGAFTIGQLLFTREYALAAAAPISGGTIAGIIVNQYATAAGKPEIGGFAMLLVGFQMFLGMPIASFLLKKESNRLLKEGAFSKTNIGVDEKSKQNLRIIPNFHKHLQSPTITLGKLALVAVLALFVANLTVIPNSDPKNYILNPNIAYLLFGLLFTTIGFLDENSMAKANSTGIFMLGVIAIMPESLKAISPQAFLKMLYPIAGTLILGAVSIALFSFITGKICGYSPAISIAIGMTALIGYPGTQIITDEVVKGIDCTEEERKQVKAYILPKMLIGGFATVTIASVVFAGLIAPLIFK